MIDESVRIKLLTPKEDDIIAYSYLRMKSDGIIDFVFNDNVPSLVWMAEYFSNPSRKVAAVIADLKHGPELIGLVWLDSIAVMKHSAGEFKRGECAAVFFRKTSPRLIRSAAWELMSYAFGEMGIDLLYALTPDKNRAARMFLPSIGFTVHGVIPSYTVWRGTLCDAIVWAISREQFMSKVERGERYAEG